MSAQIATPDRPVPAVGAAEFLKFSYAALSVDPSALAGANSQLKVILGEDYAGLKANRDARDGADSYHLTILGPRELRQLNRALKGTGKRIELPAGPIGFEILGIGSAANERSRSWFAVCRSEAVAAWRSALELPDHDLHITLAFGAGGDVHGEPKGISSLISI